ncbi:hypothetical protein JRQ81_000198, partial [Phrynocephalus forsythii]
CRSGYRPSMLITPSLMKPPSADTDFPKKVSWGRRMCFYWSTCYLISLSRIFGGEHCAW